MLGAILAVIIGVPAALLTANAVCPEDRRKSSYPPRRVRRERRNPNSQLQRNNQNSCRVFGNVWVPYQYERICSDLR